MRIVYTTCSLNHLGQALSLGHSLKTYNPDVTFLIGLADKINGRIDKTTLPFGIVEAAALGLEYLDEMSGKYTTIELNCALKPHFAAHFLETYAADKLIYLDSDILVFNSIDHIFECLDEHDIVLTPHLTSSLPAGKMPNDRDFLNAGIYNAGFFAVKKSIEALRFIDWWKGKLRNECYMRFCEGMFVDQLWLNLAPLYFNNVLILKDPGCNVAYWNLHERRITETGGVYYVNGVRPLVFYHFSGADKQCLEKGEISKYQDRHRFDDRPDILPLFRCYVEMMEKNSSSVYAAFHCYYSNTGGLSALIPDGESNTGN